MSTKPTRATIAPRNIGSGSRRIDRSRMDAHSEAILEPDRRVASRISPRSRECTGLRMRPKAEHFACGPLPLWIKGRLFVIRENSLRPESCWPYVFVNPLDVKSPSEGCCVHVKAQFRETRLSGNFHGHQPPRRRTRPPCQGAPLSCRFQARAGQTEWLPRGFTSGSDLHSARYRFPRDRL